jgi:glycosyltransferase involved in cell wall biosynthesis
MATRSEAGSPPREREAHPRDRGDALAQPRVPVSVIIAARDEAAQIAECIASVAWAVEVLVVENDSTDDTLALAELAGATAFSHPFTTIGRQRNAAIERARAEWVLVLDADERGDATLGEAVARAVADARDRDAFRVPRRNWFLGRAIRHGGWERDRPVRLFRRALRYDERPVHEHVVVDDARVGTLEASLAHVPYATLDEYFAKLERYTRDWARQHHARGRRAGPWAMVLKPPARFVSMYLLRGGFLDGVLGLVLAVLAALSVGATYARLWELGRRGAEPPRGPPPTGESAARAGVGRHHPDASRVGPTRE